MGGGCQPPPRAPLTTNICNQAQRQQPKVVKSSVAVGTGVTHLPPPQSSWSGQVLGRFCSPLVRRWSSNRQRQPNPSRYKRDISGRR